MKKASHNHDMTLLEAVQLLHIDCNTARPSTYIQCPVCGKRREKKLNLNFAKDVYRCAKCGDKASGTEGGPLGFWMLMTGIQDPKEAAKNYYQTRDGVGNGSKSSKKVEVKKPEYTEEKIAPVEVRAHTYELMLSLLKLRDRHSKDLLSRGLTWQDIKSNAYKSTPTDPKGITQRLLLKGATLEGVPGFYMDKDGKWTMRDFGSGIFIPQRNSKGQIQGFQIRLDDKEKKCENCTFCDKGFCDSEGSPHTGKKVRRDFSCDYYEQRGGRYISFSSRDFDHGTGAKVFVHFREGSRGSEEVIITEGALKADVISALSGYSVLSVPGVNSLKMLPGALKALLAKDLCRVRIAYDMDLRENVQVEKARQRLESLLRYKGIPYRSMIWDEAYKGLDDYLLAKRKGDAK